MKIIVIGCGGAFSTRNYNQSFLLEEDGRSMLIDCGRNVPDAINELNININEIDDIYISHAHGDHIGGLELLALKRYDWVNKPVKIKTGMTLIANERLLRNLWTYSLKGGLETMEGFVAKIDTFFKPKPIEPNQSFIWQGWKFSLIQQIHIMSGSIMTESFGLFIEKKNHKSVYFTIDAQYFQPKQVLVFYKNADIIFQDCECTGVNMKDKEYVFHSGVHASYAELAGYKSANASIMPKEIRNKIYLSHYQDFVLDNKDFFGNSCNWDEIVKEEGFIGFAYKGQKLEV